MKKSYWQGITAAGAVILLFAVVMLSKRYLFDNSAQEGKTELETLQEYADQDNFQLQVATTWNFETAASEAEGMITNPDDNGYKTAVTVTLDESGEEVYRSDILEPGERVRYVTLSLTLEKGSYPATVMFAILDLHSGEQIGKVAAQIEIKVLS